MSTTISVTGGIHQLRRRCKREKLTLNQTEVELGLPEVPYTEQVKRGHDNQDCSDVGRSVVGLPNGTSVRMEAALAASENFDPWKVDLRCHPRK